MFAQLNSRADGSPLTSSAAIATSIDGGSDGAGAGTLTHLANGSWRYAPTQGETNGDVIRFQFTHSTGIDVTVSVITQPGDIYARLGAPAGASIAADIAEIEAETDDIAAIKTQTDKMAFTVTNKIDANTLAVGGTTQTARDLGASVLLSAGTGTGQLDFTSGVVKSNLAQILGTALTETSGLIAGAFKKFFNVASPTLTCLGIDQAGDSYARIGAPAGASASADIAAVKVDTAAVKAKTDNLPSSPAATGDIMKVSSGTGANQISLSSGTVTVGTNNDKTGYTASTVSDKTGYALTSAYDPAKTASQAGDAMALTSGERTTLTAAIWAALTSALTTVGSIGKLLVDNINATISSRLATSGYTVPPSAATVAGAVWDESISDHLTSGTTGAALNAAGSAGDPWTTPLPGVYGAGTAGKLVGDNLDAAVSTRLATSGYTAPDNSDISAIKAKTDNLPASPAAVGDIPTATQNADALLKRDMSAVSGEAARSPLNAIRFLRNKWGISGTTLTVTKEDDTTTAWTGTVSTDASAVPIIGSDPA